jgi:ribosomal protein S12 methylthiotransferase accessory factor YcaO
MGDEGGGSEDLPVMMVAVTAASSPTVMVTASAAAHMSVTMAVAMTTLDLDQSAVLCR